MKVADFLIMVATMRKAQREYFTTRSRRALEEAKKAERQVDQVLKAHVPQYLEDNKLF